MLRVEAKYAMRKVMDGMRLLNLMGKVTPVFLLWNALLSYAKMLKISVNLSLRILKYVSETAPGKQGYN